MTLHLLVPTDGSPQALEAARFAALLAPGGTLTLLHVASDAGMLALAGLDAAAAAIGGAYAEWEERERIAQEQESARVLARTREALPAALRVETVADHGRAGERVLAQLEEGPYEGCVVGSRGHGLLSRTLLGSVSDTLVRHSQKLVALGRHASARGIVVGVDGSAPSVRACAFAAALARRTGAPLTLVHAVEFAVDTYAGADRARIEGAFAEKAAAHFTRARAELGGVAANEQLLFHEPATAILQEAGRRGDDVIVLGRRGMAAGSNRWAIGSVSLRVAMRAEASVVLVP